MVMGSLCGFTVYAKSKHTLFACPKCGSRRWRVQLDLTANAHPSSSTAESPAVIRDGLLVYAVSLRCNACAWLIPGSGYTPPTIVERGESRPQEVRARVAARLVVDSQEHLDKLRTAHSSYVQAGEANLRALVKSLGRALESEVE